MLHARILRSALLSTSLIAFAPVVATAQDVTPSNAPETTGAPTAQTLAMTPAFGAPQAQNTSPYGSLDEIQACPYKQIRAAYDEAVIGKDALDTLAVEREVLILCEERNALVAKLLQGESTLRDLLAPQTASVAEITDATTQDANASANDTQANAESMLPDTWSTVAPQPASAGSIATQCEPAFATRYVSPSLTQTASDTSSLAVAGIVDTTTKTDFIVRLGDSLPGGYKVEQIDANAVTLTRDGLISTLPRVTPARAPEGFYVETLQNTAPSLIPPVLEDPAMPGFEGTQTLGSQATQP